MHPNAMDAIPIAIFLFPRRACLVVIGQLLSSAAIYAS
jgi:hypothetical protein